MPNDATAGDVLRLRVPYRRWSHVPGQVWPDPQERLASGGCSTGWQRCRLMRRMRIYCFVQCITAPGMVLLACMMSLASCSSNPEGSGSFQAAQACSTATPAARLPAPIAVSSTPGAEPPSAAVTLACCPCPCCRPWRASSRSTRHCAGLLGGGPCGCLCCCCWSMRRRWRWGCRAACLLCRRMCRH